LKTTRTYDVIDSPLGKIYLIFDDANLTAIDYRKPALQRRSCPDVVKRQFSEYFRGERSTFSIRTVFTEGTPFQKKVWKALLSIPYGKTKSYKWIAERIGSPGAFRAVGQAVGRNPLPIIYPCHRVINADGNLGGYSGGLRKKRILLDLERSLPSGVARSV